MTSELTQSRRISSCTCLKQRELVMDSREPVLHCRELVLDSRELVLHCREPVLYCRELVIYSRELVLAGKVGSRGVELVLPPRNVCLVGVGHLAIQSVFDQLQCRRYIWADKRSGTDQYLINVSAGRADICTKSLHTWRGGSAQKRARNGLAACVKSCNWRSSTSAFYGCCTFRGYLSFFRKTQIGTSAIRGHTCSRHVTVEAYDHTCTTHAHTHTQQCASEVNVAGRPLCGCCGQTYRSPPQACRCQQTHTTDSA